MSTTAVGPGVRVWEEGMAGSRGWQNSWYPVRIPFRVTGGCHEKLRLLVTSEVIWNIRGEVGAGIVKIESNPGPQMRLTNLDGYNEPLCIGNYNVKVLLLHTLFCCYELLHSTLIECHSVHSLHLVVVSGPSRQSSQLNREWKVGSSEVVPTL